MNDLHLNRAKRLEDFANHVTLLLWERLLQEKGLPPPDPHCFPGMSQALNRVIQHRVGPCSVCTAIYDSGELCASSPSTTVSCEGHMSRLRIERGQELADLLGEVEKEVVDFLSRHDPTRATFKSLPEKVHHAAEKIEPYLIENMACSHCP